MSDPHSGRNDLIGRILGYMDRPWKVLAIAGLLILIGLGYAAWNERDNLVAAFLTPPKHGMVLVSKRELTDAAIKIVKINQAAMAQVWAFDIRGNAVRFITGINKDGTAWQPSDLHLPDRLPVLTAANDGKYLVSILYGDTVCVNLVPMMPALLFERLFKAGIQRVCIIPIPPQKGKVLALFLVGWLELPDSRLQAITIEAAAELANNLVGQ
jgi:hypothetical protein